MQHVTEVPTIPSGKERDRGDAEWVLEKPDEPCELANAAFGCGQENDSDCKAQ